MTDEEKQAVLQFMGVAYGDAHKQDQMIIGQSGQLQPSSHVMKERFEEVLTDTYSTTTATKRAGAGSCTGAGCLTRTGSSSSCN